MLCLYIVLRERCLAVAVLLQQTDVGNETKTKLHQFLPQHVNCEEFKEVGHDTLHHNYRAKISSQLQKLSIFRVILLTV